MRVNLQSLGCRLNEAELQQWATDFQRRGYVITDDVRDADLLVINTCAVTGEAGRKSRQFMRRAQRNNPRAKLVVSGCYATLEQRQVAAVEGVDLVVPNQDKDRLVQRVQDTLELSAMPLSAQRPATTALFQRGRSRAFIKVQDGCRWRCAYCIVTVARGAERSRPTQSVVEQINRHAEHGVQEVVLTGVHLGGYGSDINTDLCALVRAILRETDVPRIRFGSLEPWDLRADFFTLFENDRLMPHLHLPLQSGSDEVLKRMSRRCRTADFADLVATIRQVTPDFNVTTDIIVGFPGETDAQWRAGYDFIQSIGFGHTHIFTFSPRAGTKAAALSERVAPAVVKQRTAQLRRLAEEMQREFVRRQTGKTYPLLLEDHTRRCVDGKYVYAGYTPNYLRLEFTSDDAALGNTVVWRQVQDGDVAAGC